MLYVRYLGKDYPAADDPTGWLGPEATDVEKHFGADLMAVEGDPRKLTNRQSAYAIAYVTLRREHRKAFTWEVIERMTLGEVAGLFVNLDANGNEIDADVEQQEAQEITDPQVPLAARDPSTQSGSPTGGGSS